MHRVVKFCVGLMLTVCQYSYGQWIEVSYDIEFIANLPSSPPGGLENIREIFDSEKRVLYCTKDEAYLLKNSSYRSQNTLEEITLKSLFKDIEYWSLKSKSATSKLVVDGVVKSSPIDFVIPQWSFTEEFKVINGYKCRLARTSLTQNRNQRVVEYAVWYTTEIPLPWGPQLLLGLPGLIVQMETEDRIIYLRNINYNKKLPQRVTALYKK